MPSPVTITGTITDCSGTNSTPSNSAVFVRFRLRGLNGAVPVVTGTNIIAETQIDVVPDNSGNFSQNLWGNNSLSQPGSFYTVEFWSVNRITSSGNWIFNASQSLNNAAQLNAPPVPAGFSLVLENNGALNSSQSTLNLESTDGSVTITDVGGGTLNLQTATTAFATAGQGWLAPTDFMPFTPTTLQAVVPAIASGAGSGNGVGAVQFILPYSVTIRAISMYVVSGGGSGYATAAIYNAAGTTKLVDAGANAFDTHTASQTLRTATITPVTLPAGLYWLAVGSTDVAGSATGYSMYQYLAPVVNANSVVRYGSAANSLTAGAMPSSLGTVTGFGTGSSTNIPLVLFSV